MTPATDRPSYAAGVVATAAKLGWDLMPWQRLVLQVGLAHEGGQLAHRDVDVAVPRQQGKSSTVLSLLVHRMLAAPGQ
jgi:hypothetical protein